MTRQLLHQALDALTNAMDSLQSEADGMSASECNLRPNRVRALSEDHHFASIVVDAITAALAQPEQITRWPHAAGAAIIGATPPAPDADQLRRELAEMKAQSDRLLVRNIQLACELADMTAQRDRFKSALELSCVANWQIAEDRLDAQRYRWLRQDTPTSAVPRVWRSNESAEPTKCLDGSKLDDEIDQAMKGGQP